MDKKMCYSPFQSMEIYNDGVYVCCSNWCNRYKIGDIFTDSAENIWNSLEVQELRQKILNDDYSLCNENICPYINQRNFESKITQDLKCEIIMQQSPQIIKFAYDEECNIACNICRENIKYNSQEQNDKYDSYIDSLFMPLLKNAKIVIISASGDPFGSRHSRKLIKRISEVYPDIKFDFLTNGTLCTPEMLSELAVINKIFRIRISLNAAKSKTYGKVVKNGELWFEKIIKNIKYLNDLMKKYPFELHLQMVVSSENYKDMPNFIKLAKKYNAVASMWEYQPDLCAYHNDYSNSLDIVSETNPMYKDFIKVLNHKSLDEKNVNLSPLFHKLRKESKYKRNFFVDKLFKKNK